MNIYVGADHNGYKLKAIVIDYLRRHEHTVTDMGDTKLNPSDDFPKFASNVVTEMLASHDLYARGILICGSGQGMCMAANRHKGIRAALGYDIQSAKSSRNDDDSNVLCLPALTLGSKTVTENILHTWLTTSFAGATRFRRRLRQLDAL